MRIRPPRWVRSLAPLGLILLSASEAHAQRVPEFVLWSAGASLFAPFVAVLVKRGILRLLALEAKMSRLWSISAIEWVLWFPVAFIVLRSGRSSSAPVILLALFALAVWFHRELVAKTRWGSALVLSLVTPVVALLLPFVALVFVAFVEKVAN
jgi:hypothetical protein